MKLVYKETNVPVKVGDKVRVGDASNEMIEVTYFRQPHKPASDGKVSVKYKNGSTSEFYVGVIDAHWIEREDRHTIVYVEHTDTFGGEANYSWATRKTLELPMFSSDRSIILAAKKALGISGVRCRRTNIYGNDDIRLDLVGFCQVVFISFPQ